METLFETAKVRSKLRTHDGRFCTKREAEIDSKYRTISIVENENYRLKRKVIELERTVSALRSLFAQHERYHKDQSLMIGFLQNQ